MEQLKFRSLAYAVYLESEYQRMSKSPGLPIARQWVAQNPAVAGSFISQRRA